MNNAFVTKKFFDNFMKELADVLRLNEADLRAQMQAEIKPEVERLVALRFEAKAKSLDSLSKRLARSGNMFVEFSQRATDQDRAIQLLKSEIVELSAEIRVLKAKLYSRPRKDEIVETYRPSMAPAQRRLS
jgi:hypothetical protein